MANVNVIKAGVKTTEFFIVILTIIGSAAAAFQGILRPEWAAIVSAVSTAAYAISRGLVKK